MSPADKKLLLRLAARMERAAREKFEAAPAERREQARRTRDTELGDVEDLKDYVVRVEREVPVVLVDEDMMRAGAEAVIARIVPGAAIDDPGALAVQICVAMLDARKAK